MAKKNKNLSLNEFLNVKDIRGQILYTKDNYAIGFIKNNFFNLDLLSREEKRARTNSLTSSFMGDRQDFCYFTLPREVDLDNYKNFLKSEYKSETVPGTRKILEIMYKQSCSLSTSGENYEHQHYLKVWRKITHTEEKATQELIERMRDIVSWYKSIGIKLDILDEKEIIKLCNLFGNSQQAGFETVDNNFRMEQVMIIE